MSAPRSGLRGRLAYGLSLAALLTVPAVAGEAPMLAEQVAAGELPPLEERLPANPRVLEPIDSIGEYGGTWRTGAIESADTWTMRTVGYDHMFHWKPDWTGVVPNIVESHEVSDDATTYTITLREGMKWSDGEPFDADDLMFAYEIWSHPDLGGFPSYMVTSDGEGVVEQVDDRTIRVTFPSPNATFLEGMAQVTTILGGDAFTKYPRHHMAQFHADHAEGDLDAMVREAGVNTWQELFQLRADTWRNANKPTLSAWVVTQPFGGTRVVAERNPYYWKVDPEGNQLPYIDRVVFEVMQDPQVLLLKALGGEVDMTATHINTFENKAVLFDGMEQGGYKFFNLEPSDANIANYGINQVHKNETLGEVFRNRKFREALSHAIDRQALIDLVFIGQAQAQQTAVQPTFALLYNEQLATQHLEYDMETANRLLDEAGFTERDANGMRLGPDDEPIRFAVLTRSDKKFMGDLTQLIVESWRELGLDARMDLVERSLVRSRKDANEHDIIIEDFPGGKRDALVSPQAWVPMHHNAAYGIPWYDWHRGEGGQEPPEDTRRQLQLWEEINATADEAERVAKMKEILEIAADQFYNIGIGVPLSGYGIVSEKMRNVPETMEGSYWFAPPGPTNPPTYYFVGGQN